MVSKKNLLQKWIDLDELIPTVQSVLKVLHFFRPSTFPRRFSNWGLHAQRTNTCTYVGKTNVGWGFGWVPEQHLFQTSFIVARAPGIEVFTGVGMIG